MSNQQTLFDVSYNRNNANAKELTKLSSLVSSRSRDPVVITSRQKNHGDGFVVQDSNIGSVRSPADEKGAFLLRNSKQQSS